MTGGRHLRAMSDYFENRKRLVSASLFRCVFSFAGGRALNKVLSPSAPSALVCADQTNCLQAFPQLNYALASTC